MNSQENHNATNDNEEGARSGKRVRFHLPPLPSSSRPNSVERELALEKYFLTDHLAQSLLHEHFFGETHFQDRLEEVEHCAACISPTPPSKMTLMAAIEHPESTIEVDPATPYDDDRAVASLTGTEQKEECERHQQPQRKRRKLRGETTRLKDIIGHASVKLRIDELILPLGLPAAIADSVLTGIRSIPASILLHGPPGCGKVSTMNGYTTCVMSIEAFTHAYTLFLSDKVGSSNCGRGPCRFLFGRPERRSQQICGRIRSIHSQHLSQGRRACPTTRIEVRCSVL